MASTTFVDYTTPAVNAAWLNDANDATYHEYNADLVAAELAAGVTPANPLYPAEDIRRYSNFQDAIDVGNVTFPPGTYNYASDFNIPGNRKIWVQRGATVINTGGRFTAYNVENVEWHIDGWVKSVAMATAPYKSGWPNPTEIPGYFGVERGFIEFGMPYTPSYASRWFWVHGNGVVSGDWTGTPNTSDLINQVNKKGIACWNSANVLVEGLHVFGFEGEAVYGYFFDEASSNIVFQNLSVYNSRFNALNFNAGANGGNCAIRNNKVENCYQVESSVGEITGNYIINTVGSGIFTGVGTGNSLKISGNIIRNAGLHSIAAAFASTSPVSEIQIENNLSIDPEQYGVYVDYIREFTIVGNFCIGSGTGAGAYDIGINHSLRGRVANNTFVSPGGFAQDGRIAIDANSFDVAVDPDSNIYLNTTGTQTPSGNVVATVASATALTLPVLGSIFSISGTTDITSIVATGNNGRRVTLVFQGILTFTDGSNLKLAGNLVTTADDTITLVCDGTNWYETARSVN